MQTVIILFMLIRAEPADHLFSTRIAHRAPREQFAFGDLAQAVGAPSVDPDAHP